MDESKISPFPELEHLLADLTSEEKRILLESYPTEQKNIIDKLRNSFHSLPTKEKLLLYQPRFYSGNLADSKLGRFLLSQNKVGALIVAGGQGTRLGYTGAKGAFPVTVVNQKSLFQLFAEKIKFAAKRIGVSLPLAIMTSRYNDEATKRFFLEHNYFGLDPDSVGFFTQGEYPFLDHDGRVFLESPAQIASAPNGNGSSIAYFYHSPLWSKWKKKGIQYLLFLPIDNPLADPFDEELIGFHHRMGNEISLKATLRSHSQEKVGVIVLHKNKIEVIEYHELKAYFKDELLNEPSCANLSLFSINLEFIEKFMRLGWSEMPLHSAQKKAVKVMRHNEKWQVVVGEAWKFEHYIFDILPFADKVEVLIYPREKVFAPLKNFSGEDSINTVQAALQAADLKAFYRISGITPPLERIDHPIELSQEFYYPTREFLMKWKGQKLPDQFYIEG